MSEIQPNRIGLTFSQEHITTAQAKNDSDHIATAFDYLTNTQDTVPLIQALKQGLRYRFMNDSRSGHQVVKLLQGIDLNRPTQIYHDHIRQAFGWLNVVEMVRDLPAWLQIETNWLDMLRTVAETLNQPPDSATLLDGFWLGTFNISAGIVLNDPHIFRFGEDFYQLAIAEHIHPEGYLKGIVDEEHATSSYHKQVSGTAALVLMAEIAEQAGVNLWDVDNRGITPITSATYTMYYYYYPEKWKWEPGLSFEDVDKIMQSEGAFIEIANRRNPLRAIETLFDDQRPMFNPTGGGLTTLTHGTPTPLKKRRWSLFG